MELESIKKIARYALSRLKEYGADEAQCEVAIGSADELNVDAGNFSLLRSTFDSSVVMKAVKDMKKGVISINKTDEKSIDEAAKACVENAISGTYDECLSIAEKLSDNEDFFDGALNPDRDKLFDRINEFMTDLNNEFPKVLMEQLVTDYSDMTSVFVNTNGVEFSYRSPYYSINTMYSAHDGDKTTSFNSTNLDFTDLDKKIMDMGVERLMYTLCEKELDAEPFEGKFSGRAVFAPSCLDGIIGSAVFSFTGDNAMIDGTSPWKDKLNKKVASDCLNVSLVPLDKRIIGGERYTSEGYKTENCDIIKDGVLKSFTLSQYAAKKTGGVRCSTGSGCMEVKAGETPYQELIKKIDKGILVCRLSGGIPAGNGDFSAVAKNSFLIENGKITKPILETMISGNLSDMMMNVADISKETVEDGSSIFPYVAFDGVTVSGK